MIIIILIGVYPRNSFVYKEWDSYLNNTAQCKYYYSFSLKNKKAKHGKQDAMLTKMANSHNIAH